MKLGHDMVDFSGIWLDNDLSYNQSNVGKTNLVMTGYISKTEILILNTSLGITDVDTGSKTKS